jgi:hypothetical protein
MFNMDQDYLWLVARSAKRLIAGSVNCDPAYDSNAPPILTPTGIIYIGRTERGRLVPTRIDIASGAKSRSVEFETAAAFDGDESLMFRMRSHNGLALRDVLRTSPRFAPAS